MGFLTDEEVKGLYEKFDRWKKDTLSDGHHLSLEGLKVWRQGTCGKHEVYLDIAPILLGVRASADHYDQLFDECCTAADKNRDSISFEQFEEVMKEYK